MRNRILLQWLAGTLGGLLGWMLVEPCPWLTTDPRPGQPPIPMSAAQLATFGLVVGACVSGSIAAAFGAGSAARRNRYLAMGILTGAAGGALGLLVGQFIYQTIGGSSEAMAENHLLGPFGFVGLILARSLGWAGIGAGLGLLQGCINGSWPRSRNGLVGGAIGGLMGGLAFELLVLVTRVTTDSLTGTSPFFFLTGEIKRAIGLTVTGSAIGLFVGLTERALRKAWVRVRLGRNEGHEFLVEKGVSTIGRDELSDVPLFGDPGVAAHHATISRSGSTFVLDAVAAGVLVNGQPVQRAPLQEGDVISIAGREIEFHQKGAPRRLAGVDVARPAASRPLSPEGVCPYCGQRKDARGLCACSPVSTDAAQPSVAHEAKPATYRLAGVSGPYAGRTFGLPVPAATVGRDAGRDICLADDPSASRVHARLVVRPAGVEVVDEGSSNGTYVNGARVVSATAHEGDELRFGESTFRLEAA